MFGKYMCLKYDSIQSNSLIYEFLLPYEFKC